MVKSYIRKLTSSQVIMISFLAVILLGAFLLSLPISSIDRTWTPFVDSLFTAVSATCVTGLIVHDTATYWSIFGKTVIITLIQIGGLGVVTIAFIVSVISGSKISLIQRNLLKDSISGERVGGVIRMALFILKAVIIFEVTGAVLMMPVFCRDFGIGKGILYSFFHSISAFCNAGFDLMGVREQFSSLTSYSDNAIINIVIMLLIIIGGLGFYTWKDLSMNKFHFQKYSLQTKLIIIMTVVLIFIPALIFYFTEYSKLPVKQAILASLFQSVTTRTAGFNSMDLTQLKEPNILLMVILMLMGGAPGSTAGGMKITTVAVMFISAISVFYHKEDSNAFGRRLPQTAIRTAAAVLLMYIFLFVTGACLISYMEGYPILACMFETSSAVATVGLTLGMTPHLGIASKFILIILMYFGRVGGLTIMYAAIRSAGNKGFRRPEEQISIG